MDWDGPCCVTYRINSRIRRTIQFIAYEIGWSSTGLDLCIHICMNALPSFCRKSNRSSYMVVIYKVPFFRFSFFISITFGDYSFCLLRCPNRKTEVHVMYILNSVKKKYLEKERREKKIVDFVVVCVVANSDATMTIASSGSLWNGGMFGRRRHGVSLFAFPVSDAIAFASNTTIT